MLPVYSPQTQSKINITSQHTSLLVFTVSLCKENSYRTVSVETRKFETPLTAVPTGMRRGKKKIHGFFLTFSLGPVLFSSSCFCKGRCVCVVCIHV